VSDGLQFHSIASIFPLFEGESLERLADDIRQNGLRESAWLFEGKVLDGRNRATACTMAGVKLETREFSGSYAEAIAFVWSENFHRRHLDSGQAAVADAKRVKMVSEYAAIVEKMKAEAKGRKAQAKGKPRGEKQASLSQLVGQETDPHENRTSAVRAKMVGTNRRYIEAAESLLESAPEKLEAVEKGEKTLSQVIRETKREEAQSKLAALPSDKFRVFYADPPWSYGNSGSGLDQYGPAERHYPAMTIAELCALDVKSIADADAVLFLWVTSPLLDECWPVIKAWGFDYKTSFVWDKIKHNFGHYNSVRHEFLLVCTRGSCTPDVKKLFDSVLTIERSGKHSKKPQEFREIIETLYTHGKRIELFARAAAEGWETYGNEV
jgi:N6-adenosine-specific RNA methylase IME4